MRTVTTASAFAIVIAVFLTDAQAQAQAQGQSQIVRTHVRGTVEKLDGHTLVVTTREGPAVSVMLAPNFTVSGVVKRTVDDIKEGDFVASTSVKGDDGKLHAVELHFLPQSARERAEGQRPADLVPNSVMTNAVIAGIATGTDGHVLKVTYKGNESEVIVGPDVPVVAYVPANTSLLKPGAAVSFPAEKMPDGMLTATRVTAEKEGVKPPM